MKPAKIILRRDKDDGGENLMMVHCKHTWKCDNERTCATNLC
jgi:hypothetical protein